MTTTIGSLDLNTLNDLYSDSNQYFWFESDSSATYGAGAHVTLVPDTTFISNPTGQNILMNTDGFSIRNGLLPMMTLDNDSLDFNIVDTTAGTYTTTATFTATSAQIGQSDGSQSYMYLDYHSMQAIDKEGDPYFYVSDLRSKPNWTAEITEYFIGDGTKTTFRVSLRVLSVTAVYVNDVATSAYTLSGKEFTFTTAPAINDAIRIEYVSSDRFAKAFTLGERKSGETIAPMSVAEGIRTTANGSFSHVEGYYATASGQASHAEGQDTMASGQASHAEGTGTTASGPDSHAQNRHTTAGYPYQTAIGQYNDNKSGNLFEVGNGYSGNPSNAFEVNHMGHVVCAGSLTLNKDKKVENFVVEKNSTYAGTVRWEYQKWADGTVEMWGDVTTTLAIGTASGSLYTTANTYDIAMPSFVTRTDFITAELSGGGWADITSFGAYSPSFTPPQLRLYAPTSYGSATRTLRYYFRGQWA